MYRPTIPIVVLLSLSAFLFAAQAIAQTPAPSPWSAGLVGQLEPFVVGTVVPFIVWGVREAQKRIPSYLLPLIAGALGPAVDQAYAYALGVPSLGWKGIAAGLAGVGLREIVDQLKKTQKPTTV